MDDELAGDNEVFIEDVAVDYDSTADKMDASPSEIAKVFNKRVPNFNSLLVCRNKQCAPAEMTSSRQYIFNALAHLIDNNSDEKALLCEGDPQSHVCINPYLTVPAKIGVVPSYVYFDAVKIIDASLVKGSTAVNLVLGYELSYNGQTPKICKPDRSILYVKSNKGVVLNGEGFKCDMTSMGTTTVRVMFDIDYIDMDYGYIGGYYSIGLSGPANGGGYGYGIIRLMKDAFPLNPVLMELSKKEIELNNAEEAKKVEAVSEVSVSENTNAKEVANLKEDAVDTKTEDNTENEAEENPVDSFEVGSDVTEALKKATVEAPQKGDMADNILKNEENLPKEESFEEYDEVQIEDLDEYIK